MTDRQKVAHLYRRLGFGATVGEIDAAEKAGVDATIAKLVQYEALPELPVSPHEFVWREKEEADLGSYRYRNWWILQMLQSPRPLQEKLAIFWHDHFAVADNKVEFGPMMLDYLQTLRKHAGGKFETLLGSVARDPAMMKYLDMTRAVKGHPNENFAREVMELFTLGIGNYSEKDVQDAARALTGWGYFNAFWEMPGDSTAKMKDSIKYDRPFSAFMYMPAMRDSGPKTVLGKTADHDGDSLIKLLATHPKTAEHLAHKLWEYFAYPDPDPAVVDRIAGAFRKSGGDIQKTLLAIVKSKEFFSEKAQRAIVKSPVDYIVPLLRQTETGEWLMSLRKADASVETPIPQKIMDVTGGVTYFMDREGMSLLNPPDVSGWKWGTGWISSQNMIERINFAGVVVWGEDGKYCKKVHEYVKAKAPSDATAAARLVCAFFDAEVPEESIVLIGKAMDANNKVDFVGNFDWFRGAMHRGMRLLVGAPQFHMM